MSEKVIDCCDESCRQCPDPQDFIMVTKEAWLEKETELVALRRLRDEVRSYLKAGFQPVGPLYIQLDACEQFKERP